MTDVVVPVAGIEQNSDVNVRVICAPALTTPETVAVIWVGVDFPQ